MTRRGRETTLGGGSSPPASIEVLRPPAGPRTVVLMVEGPITASTVAALCARLRVILHVSDVQVVTCDVRTLTNPDAGVVDAVARLQLTARRLGRSIRLRYASGELRDLLGLVGLRDAVPCVDRDHGRSMNWT